MFRPYAIYIIVDDGRCAYYRPFSESAPPPDLVSMMLTAMQSFVNEVTGSHFTELTAGPFYFMSEKVGPFLVVLVSNKSAESAERVKYLSLKFIQRFRLQIENWDGFTEVFSSFDQDIKDIFPEATNIRLDPSIPLDASTLLLLRGNMSTVAKALLVEKESTVSTISEKTGLSIKESEDALEELLLLGHVGKYKENNEIIYFVV